MRSTGGLAALALTAVYPCLTAAQSLPRCAGNATTAAWLPTDGRAYLATAEFGRGGSDEWLATVNGVTHRDGIVYVFDQGRPEVLVLSEQLQLLSSFGREGDGPGEFPKPYVRRFLPKYWDFGWIGSDDSTVVVYDHQGLEIFSRTGEFERHIRHVGPQLPVWGTKYVTPGGSGDVLAAIDSLSGREASEFRELQTWRIGESERTLLWRVVLPPMRRVGRQRRSLPRDPRPFWAANDACHVAVDGTRAQLFVFDVGGAHLDSIPLPQWRVPEMGALASDRGVDLPQLAGEPRASPSGSDAVLRWTGLALDPDGVAWIRLWTEDPDDPLASDLPVYAVDVASGSVSELELPAFPLAFGPNGVFYALHSDPDTDEAFLVRYELGGR